MTLSFDSVNGLAVIFTTLEKCLGFRGDIRMPAHKIKSAWLGMPTSSWKELRFPGAFVPGLIKSGTYLTPRGHEFWYVTRNKCHAVTIELEGCRRYSRLVLGFEDPGTIASSGLRLGSPPPHIEIAK